MTSGTSQPIVGELQPHRFLALDAIRLLERRDVEPAGLFLPLADDLAAVVDEAVDKADGRPPARDLADVHLRRIVRAEDSGLHPGTGGVGRHRRAGVAVGRHRHRCMPAPSPSTPPSQAARLERPGRQPTLVLDDQLAATDSSPALADVSGVRTSPRLTMFSVLRTGNNSRYRHISPGAAPARPWSATSPSREIVAHQQRLACLRQIVDLIGGIMIAFHRAFEMGDERRTLGGQIVIVFHGLFLPLRLVIAGLDPGPCSRILLKCDGCAGQARARRSALHIQRLAVGVEHGFLHRLRDGGMREDRVHQFFLCGFEVHRHHKTLDQFGHFGADHVGAEQLAGLLVEDHLYHALVLALRDRLAVADERKPPDANARPASLALASVNPTEATCGWQ